MKNQFDLATDILKERVYAGFTELKRNFKGTNPYRKEPVSNEKMLYEYDTKGFEIFSQIANTQGIEAATEYRDRMEEMKQKREARR